MPKQVNEALRARHFVDLTRDLRVSVVKLLGDIPSRSEGEPGDHWCRATSLIPGDRMIASPVVLRPLYKDPRLYPLHEGKSWIPACAGMTGSWAGMTGRQRASVNHLGTWYQS